MSKQRFFSTSFNGYNKTEVTMYIEEQASEFQKLQEISEKQKQDSQDEIKKLNERIAELESLIEKDATESEDGMEPQEVVEGKSDDSEDDEERRRKYYDFCVQMGEKLLNAEASSQLIVNDANERAEKIVETAKSEGKNLVRQTTEELRRRSEVVYEAIRLHHQKEQEIRSALDLSLRRITELIASIEELGSEDV